MRQYILVVDINERICKSPRSASDTVDTQCMLNSKTTKEAIGTLIFTYISSSKAAGGFSSSGFDKDI